MSLYSIAAVVLAFLLGFLCELARDFAERSGRRRAADRIAGVQMVANAFALAVILRFLIRWAWSLLS